MLITKIHGNVHESPLPADTHVETITMPSAQLVKRIQRLRTDHGTEVGLRLPTGSPDLKDGDILSLQDGNAVVVRVEATDVLVIRARSIHEMAVTAHTLGNRHLQAQFFTADSEYGAEVMVVQYDHTVEAYLQQAGVEYDRQERIMPVPFRHSEHTH
ncbi:urease accessory protein UreE [Luteococcus sediminum]